MAPPQALAAADQLEKRLDGKPVLGCARRDLKPYERGCAAALLLGALFAAGTVCFAQRAHWNSARAPATGHAAELRAFEAWTTEHGRRYSTPEEREIRLAIFGVNFRRVQAENARGHSYKLALNEFADRTSEEFRASHLGLAMPESSVHWRGLPHLGTDRSNTTNTSDLPAAWDWVSKGAVTPPKNQGQCGSCWAFSAVGALEGAWQLANGSLVSLSEQQFVDCSKENQGCGGGAMDPAFTYAKEAAICTETGYPYAAKAGTCSTKGCKVGVPQGAVTGWRDVTEGDERALMEAVLRQPVSVAIEADQLAFQLYSGGVLTKACGDTLDHGVLLVGYGTEGGIDYWKVKNSWGSQWGEGGYVRIQRGAKGHGQCGIQSMPSYPVVRKPARRLPTASPVSTTPSPAGVQAVVV